MGIYEPGGCSEPGAASQVRTTQGAAAGRRHGGWVCVCVCVCVLQGLPPAHGQLLCSWLVSLLLAHISGWSWGQVVPTGSLESQSSWD